MVNAVHVNVDFKFPSTTNQALEREISPQFRERGDNSRREMGSVLQQAGQPSNKAQS